MTHDILRPRLDHLTQEYVLVQAWKKTSAYIRSHNWFSDTIELDRAAVNLPEFLGALSKQLKRPDEWRSDSLRIVPAPKSQHWHVTANGDQWKPLNEDEPASKMRPLAHVSLRDQVAATALMLCLADRVETLQGDPRRSINDISDRKQISSYGNRLFCDSDQGELRHRWGSQTLYRGYYEDYRTFLDRPLITAASLEPINGQRVIVVHSDLRQFYDRVAPELLNEKLGTITKLGDDPDFFLLADRVLNWTWDKRDSQIVAGYAQRAGLGDYSNVSLPQGLVSAGFFANVVLLDFDEAVRQSIDQEIAPEIYPADFSRYVDDFRLVLTSGFNKSLQEFEEIVTEWLRRVLDSHAAGLQISSEKTVATLFKGDERPLVLQSRKMQRVQNAVSGGFDLIAGQEILDAVQGLIRSQEHYSQEDADVQSWSIGPIPDVKDETVARFAAARFRKTFRSLRPLLPNDQVDLDENVGSENSLRNPRFSRTQTELDDDVKAFALGLIQNWIDNPSNVRLLRIGLDLWPAEDTLRRVLKLLRPYSRKGADKNHSRVAWYCLSEIFRAGSTETGLVDDSESLPGVIDLAAYRTVLRDEAYQVLSKSASLLPWYLKQQALLFIAASSVGHIGTIQGASELGWYKRLVRFLDGQHSGIRSSDYATLAILARRSFRGSKAARDLVSKSINAVRFREIADRDPSFAVEILELIPELEKSLTARVREDLSLKSGKSNSDWVSLADLVLSDGSTNPLRNELSLLSFASCLLTKLKEETVPEVIVPSRTFVKLSTGESSPVEVIGLKIAKSRSAPLSSMYRPPTWCLPEECWRLQLGFLLRFILAAKHDFTRVVRSHSVDRQEATYRAPESHWHQRLYGFFSGQSAFGDDWLPISLWTERLLFALMRWPGCHTSPFKEVDEGIDSTLKLMKGRLAKLKEMSGQCSGIMLLPLEAPSPGWSGEPRPLRACIMQTAIPTTQDFNGSDLTLSDSSIRKKHRNHLSAALAAIERMLALRETHKGRQGRLDWLILPELSVHPDDVSTHLIPFSRAHKTVILAGLTYQDLFADGILVNSALWVIPVWSASHGLQVVTRRQGKMNLAPDEEKLNNPVPRLRGFRPCQWLVGYEWSEHFMDSPLWLTGSICYDATDLSLAAALRGNSDVFAIPALNRDVTTFDQMALALHYHMFQLVIVANSGLYGGSNAYCPYRESHFRQVFHLHGQPQASMAFLEIDDIAAFRRRQEDATSRTAYSPGMEWKLPPAGLK